MHKNFTCARTCAYLQVCGFQPIFAALGHVAKVLSHVTKLDIEIKDLDALESAAKKIGLVLRRGQSTYKWFGRSVGDYPLPAGMKESDLGKCTHALSVPNNSYAYEIGVREQSDGTFQLVWDFWSGGHGLQAIAGENCKNLSEAYVIEAARNAAMNNGWVTMDNQDGSLLILHPTNGTLTVYGDGTVDANGFVGTGCATAAEAVEQALGKTRETTYKDSYYTQHARVSETN